MGLIKQLNQRRALVLFSGGQDSTTALAYALERFDYVETVGFDYGQKNRVELECRQDVLQRLREEFPVFQERLGADRVLELTAFGGLSRSALTNHEAAIEDGETGLPTTFVPGRNLFFFHYAAVIGYNEDLGVLVGGMCQTDYSGYPDCRDLTLRHLQETINLGMESNFTISTPLMFRSKADSWCMAHELGGDKLVEIVRKASHSCYNGERDALHSWGYGCGECPACQLRSRGFEEWRANGP